MAAGSPVGMRQSASTARQRRQQYPTWVVVVATVIGTLVVTHVGNELMMGANLPSHDVHDFALAATAPNAAAPERDAAPVYRSASDMQPRYHDPAMQLQSVPEEAAVEDEAAPVAPPRPVEEPQTPGVDRPAATVDAALPFTTYKCHRMEPWGACVCMVVVSGGVLREQQCGAKGRRRGLKKRIWSGCGCVWVFDRLPRLVPVAGDVCVYDNFCFDGDAFYFLESDAPETLTEDRIWSCKPRGVGFIAVAASVAARLRR